METKPLNSKFLTVDKGNIGKKLICTLGIKARISKVNFSINFCVLGTLDKQCSGQF